MNALFALMLSFGNLFRASDGIILSSGGFWTHIERVSQFQRTGCAPAHVCEGAVVAEHEGEREEET
jgi:hypothetical protein